MGRDGCAQDLLMRVLCLDSGFTEGRMVCRSRCLFGKGRKNEAQSQAGSIEKKVVKRALISCDGIAQRALSALRSI